MNSKEWKVGKGEKGLSLLAFLRKQVGPTFSAKALKRAIEGKCCMVNGRTETFSSHPLAAEDCVSIKLPAQNALPRSNTLEILYEDESLILCNKPPGVVCEAPSFNALLPSSLRQAKLCHRLDKETSGIIILAKNGEIFTKMETLFREHLVHKFYLALVDGLLLHESGTIDNFLGKKHSYQGQTLYGSVAPNLGKRATTQWRTLAKGGKATFVLCEPLTGRTHQLRAHFQGGGHPILGDTQYGKHFSCTLRPQRHLLHAYKVSFPHPVTQQEIEIVAPLPVDFLQALTTLNIPTTIP